MKPTRIVTLLVATTAAMAMTACSSPSDPTNGPRPAAATTPGPSASPSTAQPAVDAYVAYTAAYNAALMDPAGSAAGYKAGADPSVYSFDPQTNADRVTMGQLAGKIRFKGTPPTPRVHVQDIELTKSPYPMVSLTDCPTAAPTWNAYNADGSITDSGTGPQPPYLITAQMILYKNHWGVSSWTADSSRTCAP